MEELVVGKDKIEVDCNFELESWADREVEETVPVVAFETKLDG